MRHTLEGYDGGLKIGGSSGVVSGTTVRALVLGRFGQKKYNS